MTEALRQIVEAEESWLRDRPSMEAHNEIPFLLSAIVEEAQEATEKNANLREELADVLKYTISAFRVLAIQADEDVTEFIRLAVMEKHACNMIRYPAKAFQNGMSYTETVSRCREVVIRDGIKDTFYEPFETKGATPNNVVHTSNGFYKLPYTLAPSKI